MNTRVRLAAIAVVVLLGGGVWLVWRPHEPAYRGRTLVAWLHELAEADDLNSRREARDAVRHIGTNGLPVLLNLIALKQPPANTKAVPWIERQQLIKLASVDAECYLAVSGFEVLGRDAHAAAAPLFHLAESTNLNVRNLALQSLAFAEPDPETLRPMLVKLSENPDPGVRLSAANFLRSFRSPTPDVPENSTTR